MAWSSRKKKDYKMFKDLPIFFKKDCQYIAYFKEESDSYILELEQKLKEYKKRFKISDIVIKRIVSNAKTNTCLIIEAYNLYFSGQINKSIAVISKLIRKYAFLLIRPLNESPLFLGNEFFYNKTYRHVNLDRMFMVRARDAKNVNSSKHMNHVPANMRDKVDSGRFSCHGIPCLYLACNSYIAYREIRKSSKENVFVSLVEILKEDLRIIDLTLPFKYILEWDSFLDEFEKEHTIFKKSSIIKTFEIVPLILACSFSHNEDETIGDCEKEPRKFKSEYVIPQLIMNFIGNTPSQSKYYSCGIAYESMQIIGSKIKGTNLAIPALDSNEEKPQSKFIGKYFKIYDPFNLGKFVENFEEYKNEVNLLNEKRKKPQRFTNESDSDYSKRINANDWKKLNDSKNDKWLFTFNNNMLSDYSEYNKLNYPNFENVGYNETEFFYFDEFMTTRNQ